MGCKRNSQGRWEEEDEENSINLHQNPLHIGERNRSFCSTWKWDSRRWSELLPVSQLVRREAEFKARLSHSKTSALRPTASQPYTVSRKGVSCSINFVFLISAEGDREWKWQQRWRNCKKGYEKALIIPILLSTCASTNIHENASLWTTAVITISILYMEKLGSQSVICQDTLLGGSDLSQSP